MTQQKITNVLLITFLLMIVSYYPASSQDKNQKNTSKKSTTSEKNENTGISESELSYLDGLLIITCGIQREELSGKLVSLKNKKGAYVFMYPNVFSGVIVKVDKLKTDSTFTQAVNGDIVKIDARQYSSSRIYTITLPRTSESDTFISGQNK